MNRRAALCSTSDNLHSSSAERNDGEPVKMNLMGVEPITPILQGSVAASGMEAHRWWLSAIARSAAEATPFAVRNGGSRRPQRTYKMTEVGIEPTGTRFSTSPLSQFAYPVNQSKRKP